MKAIILIGLLLSFLTGFTQSKEDEDVPYFHNNKFIYCNHKLKKRIKASFDMARPFLYNFAIVGNDSLYGVINQNGKIVVPIKFKNVKYNSSKFQISADNKQGLYFSVNDDSIHFSVDGNTINYIKNGVHQGENIVHKKKQIFKVNDKYGLIFGSDTIVKPIYNNLIFNNINELLVAKTDSGYGILSHQSEVLLPFEYSEITFDHSNAIYMLRKADANNHCYFYHQSDDKNIYCNYKSIQWFFHDYYLVENYSNQKYFVNFYTGKEFIILK